MAGGRENVNAGGIGDADKALPAAVAAAHASLLSRLGIPIFGSDFWGPHRRRNSNSVYDSEDSGRIFF